MPKRWIVDPKSADCETAARHWKVPALVAQLLINRGLEAHNGTETFLTPRLADLHPPESLPGIPQAASLIVDTIKNDTKIVLYGDYDVDGTTGVAILWHMLTLVGAKVSFYVPHRIEEGYGLNQESVRRLVGDGAGMIVTVDCGITAIEAAEELRREGITLIVTDHHTPHDTLPRADVIVHPAVGGEYPDQGICGAGVAFKLAWAIARCVSGAERVKPEMRELLMELLPLAALGTIADVVPLTGENRVIAQHGLARLANTRLIGLKALIESAGLDPRRISGNDVGFKLAPRINAAGRMGHARLAVELLTGSDEHRAKEIALYLEDHNRARQTVERRIARQVCERIEQENLAGDARRAIVLASEDWHAGVIGIVASRIVERYHRPTVLIALSNGEGQGSARSIRHFNLVGALAECDEFLLSFGGHAMAAGLRVAENRVDAFSEAFVELANQTLTGDDLQPKLRLDAEVELHELTLKTAETLSSLGPFGVGNPRPRLATGWVELYDEPRCVGRNEDHLQATFRQNGGFLRGIGFGLGDRIKDLKAHRRCRIAFEPMINDFRGHRAVEMQIIDLQFPGE